MPIFNSKLREITVLYVEDEIDIREELEEFLRNHDIPLVTAANGQEGWELFEKYKPQIVISDIRMPILDGLELSALIKKKSPETQIILTTAHSDTQFFLRSIEIGIDRYLLKPICLDALTTVLNEAGLKVYDHAMAIEYEQRLLKDKINGAKHFIMEQLSDLYPFPTLVTSGEQTVHVNHAFAKFLDPVEFAELQEGKVMLDDLLVQQKGMLSTIRLYNPNRPIDNKIAIRTKSGRNKMFQLFIQKLSLDEIQNYELIILNDITFLEYQNLKINHYNMALENYVSQLVYHQRLQPSVAQRPKAAMQMCELPTYEIPKAEKIESKPAQPDIKISSAAAGISAVPAPKSKEEEILRKHHHDKIPAVHYVTEIDQEVYDNTREIGEYLDNISDIFSDAKESNDTATMMLKIGAEFNTISRIMNQLFEFSDLAYAFLHLSLALEKGEAEVYEAKRHSKIVALIDAICSDLRDWINNIFILQNAIDIHYMDASLFSVILQLEVELEGGSNVVAAEDDDDDFELF